MSHNRAIACRLLLKVIQEGKSFNRQLISTYYPALAGRDIAFVMHLSFGVLRYYYVFNAYLNTLLSSPLKPKDQDVKLLMMIGLYQLFYTDTPDFATLHATVNATNNIKKNWAKGLVNAILRRAVTKGPPAINVSHPAWLENALQAAWSNDWENIQTQNLTPPPFTLRVNLKQISRDDYLTMLKTVEIDAQILAHSACGIILKENVLLENLPKFSEGFVSVQDGAGQLTPALLALTPGLRILDACSAPGSKMGHILESENKLDLIALEKDASRYTLLQATLKRLGFSIKTQCVDACFPEQYWDGALFDRILLDAPCSGTGVIRRHPDILHHRQETDIPALAKQQALLLEKLWPLLKPNGILLYATCSILPEENVEQIDRFIQNNADAKELPIEAAWGLPQKYGRQILPGEHNMDGFYYARLIKRNHLPLQSDTSYDFAINGKR